jgi:hypothetical protein
MKICLLLMLIGIIVAISYFQNRRQARNAAPATPEPVNA